MINILIHKLTFIAGVIAMHLPACSQSQNEYQISLANRTFDPKPGIKYELIRRVKDSDLYPVHGIVQLHKMPDGEIRSQLSRSGITLQQFLGAHSFFASFGKDTNFEPVKKHIRYADILIIEDKIHNAILSNNVESWALTKNHDIKVLITHFDEFKPDQMEHLLRKYDTAFKFHGQGCVYRAVLRRRDIYEIAKNEMIKWIEPGPLPFMPLD